MNWKEQLRTDENKEIRIKECKKRLITKEVSLLACSTKLKDVILGKYTTELSLVINRKCWKLSVLSSHGSFFTKNVFFWIIT